MTEIKTFLITTVPVVPAFLNALAEPSQKSWLITIGLPVTFFVVSKTVDVFVQIYLKNRKEK